MLDFFNRAAEISLALTVPAAVALFVIPFPLISVLFQRGAFEASDSAATAALLRDEVLEEVGHSQWVFVMPKMLRP